MMKGMFKRALAGVAAAALAATGLALGAGAASAAPTDTATITVHNAQPGHTYAAYRFATFANASDGDDTSYVDVNTVATPDWTQALKGAFNGVNGFTLDSEYTQNPAAAVALLTPQQLREFVNALTPVGDAADDGEVEGEEPGDVRLDVAGRLVRGNRHVDGRGRSAAGREGDRGHLGQRRHASEAEAG